MRRKAKSRVIITAVIIFFASTLIIFIRTIFNLGNFQTLKIAEIFYLAGQLAGLTGFLCLSLLIFSGETARFFDRFFGLDKIIKFQRKFSVFTMIFILSHPLFFILSAKTVWPFIIPDFSAIPFALGVISFYIFILVLIASKIYKRISYNAWQYLHLLTYALFFFALSHAFFWGSDAVSWPVRAVYLTLLAAILGGIIYRTNYKLKNRRAGRFYAKAVRPETDDSFTLSLKPAKPFSFKAGQFCFLRLNKDKLYANHPFTIASAPRETELRFTVKRTGRFTKALSELKTGEEIIIEGPYGVFTPEDETKDLIFLAGGVGITPFMSMIAARLKSNKIQKVILLYGSKTEKDVIYKKQLDNIKTNWFKKVYVLSQEPAGFKTGQYESGYVGEAIIKKYVSRINNSLFYICGPEPMKNNLKQTLNKLGVKKRDIMIEDFFW